MHVLKRRKIQYNSYVKDEENVNLSKLWIASNKINLHIKKKCVGRSLTPYSTFSIPKLQTKAKSHQRSYSSFFLIYIFLNLFKEGILSIEIFAIVRMMNYSRVIINYAIKLQNIVPRIFEENNFFIWTGNLTLDL